MDFSQFKNALILILSSTLEPQHAEPEAEAGKLCAFADAEHPVKLLTLKEVANPHADMLPSSVRPKTIMMPKCLCR